MCRFPLKLTDPVRREKKSPRKGKEKENGENNRKATLELNRWECFFFLKKKSSLCQFDVTFN